MLTYLLLMVAALALVVAAVLIWFSTRAVRRRARERSRSRRRHDRAIGQRRRDRALSSTDESLSASAEHESRTARRAARDARRQQRQRRLFLFGGAASALLVAGSGAGFVWYRARGAAKGGGEISAAPVRLAILPAARPDQHAALPRLAPPGFPDLPFEVVAVNGPGDVTIGNSALFAFTQRFPTVRDTVARVSPQGDDERGRPFRTIQAALRRASMIVLEDGDHAPFNYTSRDAKLIVAANPGRARIVPPGPRLSELPWTISGNVRSSRFDPAPHRLIDRSRRDREGFPVRLRQYASVAQLQPESWCYVDRTLHVRSASSQLEAFYGNRGDQHVVVQAGSVCLHNIRIEGMACRAEGGRLWLSHFRSFCSPDYGVSSTGGTVVMESGRIHAPAYDGHNINYANGMGSVVAAGIHVTDAGDLAAIGRPAAFNIQAGSSHSGYAVIIGCVSRRSLGQEYADTALGGAPNLSWYVGCDVGDDAHSAIDGSFGFFLQGAVDFARTGYFDTNRTRDVATPLALDRGARAYIFNNSFTDAQLSNGGELPQTYDPSAPLAAAMAGQS